MKVLYFTRQFSGLKSSLKDIKWQPKGAPTIYKVLEALEADKQIDLKNLINESDLDQSSKQWVLERTYNEYNRIHQLIELENY